MYQRSATIRKYDDESQSIEEINRAMDYILDFYQAVGGLVSEIDRKHSAFTKSSIEKIKYLMTSDHTIKGKLAEVLKLYSSKTDDERDELATVMEKHIQAGRQDFFDARSLYHKNVRSRRIARDSLVIMRNNDVEGLAEDYLMRQISAGYPIKRIRAFIDSLFADGGSEIEAENIPITCDSDFISLLLAAIRQGEEGLPYVVDMRSGRVERDGYYIPDMTIRKREVKNHVE
jgi:hypothetical protein